MSGKKQGSLWYDCPKCGQRLLKLFTTKHNDMNCGTIFPIIENDAVITPVSKAPSTSKIWKLPFIDSYLTAGVIFLSDAIIQERSLQTFSWVTVKRTSGGEDGSGDGGPDDDSPPVALQVWPIPEPTALNSPHALLTQDGLSVNDLSVMYAHCIEKMHSETVPSAKLVVIEVSGSVDLNDEFCERIKRKFKHRLIAAGNRFRMRYFTEIVSFVVRSIDGCDGGGDRSVEEQVSVVDQMAKLSVGDEEKFQVKFFEVTKSTAFQIGGKSKSEPEECLQLRFPSLDSIGGLQGCIAEMTSFLQYALTDPSAPRGFIIHGQHGSGKTLLVEAFCNSMNLHAVIFGEFGLPAGLKARAFRSYSSASTLNEAVTVATANQPAALVIENLEVLEPRSSSSRTNSALPNFTGNLRFALTSLKGSKVVVIATSSNIDLISQDLRTSNSFAKEIELPVPSVIQREDMCLKILKNFAHSLSADEIKAVATFTHGFVGADLQGLFAQAALLASKSTSKSAPEVSTIQSTVNQHSFCLSHVQEAMKSIHPSAMKSILVEVPNVRWDDIGGQKDLKLKLKQSIEWPLKHPEAFRRLGISPPKGILMYGPPGCSKTMIARAIATESGLNFLSVKSSDLFSKWVGESEKAVQKIFRTARQVAPCIVFFDEIDSLGGERGSSSGSSNVHERVLSQLLIEIDGVEPLKEVTIVAATNRPDIIDQALLRPGRLDRIVYVPLPDEEARKEIFKILFRKMPVDENVYIAELVRLTESYSGAEVTAVCHEAALHALDEDIKATLIQERHFLAALKTVRPRISKEQVQFYERYTENAKAGR